MKALRHITVLTMLFVIVPIRAAWRTESFDFQPGWNGIYLFIDASEVSLNELFADYPDIVEVWRWQPGVLGSIPLTSEESAASNVSEWAHWWRDDASGSTFDTLLPNFAYLVRMRDDALPQTVGIKGRAVVPQVRWQASGLNLVGFPVATPMGATFSTYFRNSGLHSTTSEVLHYTSGPLDENLNPAPVFNPDRSPITRGKAYWIGTEKFSRFLGPLSVSAGSGNKGLDFGTRTGVSRVMLTNETTEPINVTLTPVLSETPLDATSEVAVDELVPLRRRVFDESLQAFTSETLDGPTLITVAPNEIEAVSLYVDQGLLGSLPGESGLVRASLLRVSTLDEVIYLPVSAEKSDISGLWIGEASIEEVGSRVIRYEREADGSTALNEMDEPIIEADLSSSEVDESLPGVSKPYSLRLIVHVDSVGKATLLSHVFLGPSASSSEWILTPDQTLLDANSLDEARRLSVSHFPLDVSISLDGTFAPGALLGPAVVTTGANAPTNPFLHTYHPDHDNIDARFSDRLEPGIESFEIRRQISLLVDDSAPAGVSLGWGSNLISGRYFETISGIHKNGHLTRGIFILQKVSDIAEITTE